MAGRGELDPTALPSRVQLEVQDLVMQRVSERAPGSCAPNVEEAVRALLHVSIGYSEAFVNVATLREGRSRFRTLSRTHRILTRFASLLSEFCLRD